MEKWLPSRYFGFAVVLLLFALALSNWQDGMAWRVLAVLFGTLTAIGVGDLAQKHSTLRRNYPLMAHIRYFFEYVRPMLRQYIVESDNEEVPFSNVQRTIVHQRAK
ncbi:MAG TPA: FMN-binding glutamate synthase family protein, partial [Rhodanobacteraceae bacterium]|nr:FMN-binding glutamate synthase family protein [Rhodanobacteraceae bacterium]